MSRLERLVAVVALASACSRPTGNGAGAHVTPPQRTTMQYETTPIASGFTRPRRVPDPLVVVVRSVEAWGAFLDREGLRGRVDAAAQPDFSRRAALWITGRDDGGYDRSPTVTSVTRDGPTLSLTVALTPLPDGQALDVEARAWTLVSLDLAALAGDPSIVLALDGHTGARVEHLGATTTATAH